MNKLILSTGSDEGYLFRINNYLESIKSNSNFDENILIYLSDKKLHNFIGDIKILTINPNQIVSPNQNNCIQHGEFIKANGFDELINDDDVIFFTDGDMFIQRNLTEDEINYFKSFKDGDVYVGYNASIDDTLKDEYHRLGPTNIIPEIFNVDMTKYKIYNTGVLGMNKRTWTKLCNYYNERYSQINMMFTHYAKQQWLICFIIGTMDFNIIEMGYDIHNHTHYATPKGTTIDEDGVLRFENKVVLFKHKW
jgi:hypothetical protein